MLFQLTNFKLVGTAPKKNALLLEGLILPIDQGMQPFIAFANVETKTTHPKLREVVAGYPLRVP